MSLKEKIINGSGYSVVKIDDLDQFKKLRDILIDKMGIFIFQRVVGLIILNQDLFALLFK